MVVGAEEGEEEEEEDEERDLAAIGGIGAARIEVATCSARVGRVDCNRQLAYAAREVDAGRAREMRDVMRSMLGTADIVELGQGAKSDSVRDMSGKTARSGV